MTATLRPHQEQLLSNFMQAPRPSTLIAHWSAGSGASLMAATLSETTLTANSSARVLVLCDHPEQQDQTHKAFERLGVHAERMLPFAFRARNDQFGARAAEVWEPGNTFILSMEALNQDLLTSSLAAVEWQTIIVLGFHRSRQIDAKLSQIQESSPDCRLVVFASPSGDEPKIGTSPVVRLTTTFSDVLAAEKTNAQRFAFKLVETYPSPEEVALGNELKTLGASFLLQYSGRMDVAYDALARACQSSSAALERYLQRLKHSLDEHSHDHTLPLSVAEHSPVYGGSTESTLSIGSDVRHQIDRVLRSTAALADDSKIEALRKILGVEQSAKTQAICIVTYRQATARYIKEALELPLRTSVLPGSVPTFESEAKEVFHFIRYGGTLVTTLRDLIGLELQAHKVVLFDLPENIEHLYATLVRFEAKNQQRLPVHLFLSDERYGPVPPERFTLADIEGLF